MKKRNLILALVILVVTVSGLLYRFRNGPNRAPERAAVEISLEEIKQTEKRPKILLFNDTTGHYHFGCTGTSMAVKHVLAIYGELLLPTHKVLDSWRMEPCPSSTADFDSDDFFMNWSAQQKELIEQIKRSDICVVTGEGTIFGFDGRTGTRNLLYLMYVCKNRFGKTVYAINHSCFPVQRIEDVREDNPLCALYKKVYECIDFCAVREPKSFEILKKLGCKPHLAFDCLPLYIHLFYKETALPKELPAKYILLNGGSTFWENFERFITAELWEKYHPRYPVYFITANMPEVCADDRRCLQVIERHNRNWKNRLMGRRIRVVATYNVDEWLSVIKNAQMIISGRFHHTIAATVFKVPAVRFAGNTPKNSAMDDLSVYLPPCLSPVYEGSLYLSSLRNFLPFLQMDHKSL